MVVVRLPSRDEMREGGWSAEVGMSAIVVLEKVKGLPLLLYRSVRTPSWWDHTVNTETQDYLDKAGLVGHFQWVPADILEVVERGAWSNGD